MHQIGHTEPAIHKAHPVLIRCSFWSCNKRHVRLWDGDGPNWTSTVRTPWQVRFGTSYTISAACVMSDPKWNQIKATLLPCFCAWLIGIFNWFTHFPPSADRYQTSPVWTEFHERNVRPRVKRPGLSGLGLNKFETVQCEDGPRIYRLV